MATKQADMEQIVNEDGSVTFAFPAIGEKLTVRMEDFPQNVRDFFGIFGMRTKLRNFTALEKAEDGSAASPAAKFAELKKGYDLLVAGTLRAAREPGEKGASSTVELEAFVAYKVTKLRDKGASDEEIAAVTPVSIAAELEKLTDDQIKEVKATKRFQKALADVKAARAAARAAKLAKEAAAEEDSVAL